LRAFERDENLSVEGCGVRQYKSANRDVAIRAITW